MDLNSINCVITGISSTTAAAISRRLSLRDATIIGTYRPRETPQSLNMVGPREYGIAMDPLNPESIKNALDVVIDALQQVHVWINVVGGFEMGQTIEDASQESWRRMWELNFESVLNSTRIIIPHFKKFKTGRLINFGSASVEPGMALAAPYLVSKAAVHSLTRACAAELSDDITCNAILPRTIDTNKNRLAMPDGDFSNWVSTETIAEQIELFIAGSVNGELVKL
jgi:NAD(P)-dependent dehydrogenase (short-subunit alcohol dehydrogenase family)